MLLQKQNTSKCVKFLHNMTPPKEIIRYFNPYWQCCTYGDAKKANFNLNESVCETEGGRIVTAAVSAANSTHLPSSHLPCFTSLRSSETEDFA